ncbi:alanine/glycine:cation symporter family protein [Novipirellula artificiosorum]|uniref:Amino-acid carrier protein AlsT n=1 Tax=Novipirellula artificiosorum TaxID=2528016 RepID=A0A5C6DW87_9BACT|nr:amino acid carrier protein [Novipirellula artificiosorum]TWU40928.1 Amino-acid carrier protein AlsT [Novipirellula artificiosorum]
MKEPEKPAFSSRYPSSGSVLLVVAGFLIGLSTLLAPTTAYGQVDSPDESSEVFELPAEPSLDEVVSDEVVSDEVVSDEVVSDEVVSDEVVSDEGSSAAAEMNWMQHIDAAFGKYIVDNVAAVLFFDFGTSQWLGTSIPFVVVWLLAGGLFLTLRMGFINFRGFRHAIDLTRGVYDSPDEPGEVTHFQALAAALSATVGLGNIAGVAIAIGTGGPGATLWIIMVGLLGMTAKFTECTLGQLYRVSDKDGHVLGGPMRYLRSGLKDIGLEPLGRVLAALFMVLCIGASFGGGNAFQVGQSLEAIRDDVSFLQTMPWIYGLAMAVGVGVVIIGGIKSIGAVAGKIVPFMCVAYVLAALYILLHNVTEIPTAVATIVSEAFSPRAMYGGFLGVLVIGIKRAVFSNEAGVGSAAIAHSAAKTDEPVSEGIVALLEPFIDTVVVCTITSLVVVVTGAYEAPEMADAIANDQGAKVTLFAFVNGGHDWFRYILYVAVVLFAYSTCISWSYYGERCWVELFGVRTSLIYKGLFLAFTVLGSIVTRGNILAFSDLMILGMSFPNLLGVFLLSGIVKRQLDSYWKKYQSGKLVRVK